jgi:hypothetical protein
VWTPQQSISLIWIKSPLFSGIAGRFDPAQIVSMTRPQQAIKVELMT